MTLRTVRIGAVEDGAQYNDTDYPSAIETDQPMKAGTPVDPNDVLRLVDVGVLIGDVVGPIGATADDLVAFDGSTGKKIKDSSLSTANASDAISKKHTAGSDTALGVLGTKNPPVDADKALYRDSTAADALVTSTWTQIKAFLKTYFDSLYSPKASPTFTGPVLGDGFIHDQFSKATASNGDFSIFSLNFGAGHAGAAVVEIVYSSYVHGWGFYDGHETYVITGCGSVATNIHSQGGAKIPAPTMAGNLVTFKVTISNNYAAVSWFSVRVTYIRQFNDALGTVVYARI
jgi:hypothetical protein